MKKVFGVFGGNAEKLYLCTRNRERCGTDWNAENKDEVFETTSKKLFEKKLQKDLVVQKKVLTFASAFEKIAIKKSSLKDLDMNKQVVQDLSKDK